MTAIRRIVSPDHVDHARRKTPHACAALLLSTWVLAGPARAVETRTADQVLYHAELGPFAQMGFDVEIAAETGQAMANAVGAMAAVTFEFDKTLRTWSALEILQWPGPFSDIGVASGGDHLLYTKTLASGFTSIESSPADPGGSLVTGIGGSVRSVVRSGNYLAVGQPFFAGGAGRVLFYRFGAGGWLPDGGFTGPPGSRLGASLAMDGSFLVAGAPDLAPNGSVFVYARFASWLEFKRIDCPSIVSSNAGFGSAVALSGDNLAVGAPLLRKVVGGSSIPGVGGVYTFVDSSFLDYELETLVRPVGAAQSDNFGRSVAFWRLPGHGLVLAAGSPNANINIPLQGAAYLFLHQGNRWSEELQLLNGSPEGGERLGSAVAVGPMGVLAGAPDNADLGVAVQGAVAAWNGIVPLFYDGFESGDTSGWDVVVP